MRYWRPLNWRASLAATQPRWVVEPERARHRVPVTLPGEIVACLPGCSGEVYGRAVDPRLMMGGVVSPARRSAAVTASREIDHERHLRASTPPSDRGTQEGRTAQDPGRARRPQRRVRPSSRRRWARCGAPMHPLIGRGVGCVQCLLQALLDDRPEPGASHATTVNSSDRASIWRRHSRLSPTNPCRRTRGGPSPRRSKAMPSPPTSISSTRQSGVPDTAVLSLARVTGASGACRAVAASSRSR
ncbi:MAG: hypothetical protein XU10_C0003G0072 [Chloroflexi bacterium CSP1-4]|nr:MAG: hypothetical protein XU10_C0003G0072 [Chloroflexi bacterium CSP1-4]